MRVDNAVILAAGMAERMHPLSRIMPKPLISVKGEVLIERLIKQLQEAGVAKIIVVTGYKARKFDYLADRYGIELLFNPEFRTCNAWYSLCLAGIHLANSYVCSADYYYPENLFHTFEQHAFYSTVPPGTEGAVRGVTSDENGRITNTSVPAEPGQWMMYGHAYFDAEFSRKFKRHLEDNCQHPEKRACYWEQILQEHIQDLDIYEKRYAANQLVEIDTLEELADFDQNWRECNEWAPR